MFITVFGQKGGVAKTCSSVHIAASWSQQQKRVVLVDADRNRSATAYGARGLLPCPIVPIEAAAKATRSAEIVVTDGQASSNEEEMKNLVEGADFILLPTTTQSRSIELTIEMAQMINKYKIPYAALLVKVDSRKEASLRESTFTRSAAYGILYLFIICAISIVNSIDLLCVVVGSKMKSAPSTKFFISSSLLLA